MKAAEVVKTIRNGALSIQLRHYADGRFGFDWQKDKYDRKKVRLHDLPKAEAKAKELLGASKAGTLDLLAIDPKEYAEFLKWKATHQTSATVPSVVEKFLASKRTKGRSEKHLRGLEYTLTQFAASFPCAIGQLNRLGVEAWLDGRQVGPRRWNNLLADIVALLRFARRDGALSAEVTQVELIERKTVTVTVKTYTPAEMGKLLRAADRAWLPCLVLGAFCGLRPEEIAPEGRNAKVGLSWENILWDKRKVDVPAAVSKTRRRRFAPLTEAAEAFLSPYKKKKGMVAPRDQRFCHYLPRLTKAAGVEWKADALRHSFASYRLALTKDLAALALEMGNSPAMIFRHYLDLKFEADAQLFFGLRPTP